MSLPRRATSRAPALAVGAVPTRPLPRRTANNPRGVNSAVLTKAPVAPHLAKHACASAAAADGGGTAFPNAGVHVVPKRGQAVYFSFRSADSEGLMEDWHTEHSGCPVREGSKWVVTQWLRDGVSKENPHSRFDPSGGPVR